MKLSIIIVNYKSRAYLEKCLISIFAKIDAGIDFEVIVVNNDAEQEIVALTEAFPKVRVMQNQKNSGFGSANNFGAKEAKGEVLFFLNPDTEVSSGKISSVLEEFSKDVDLGILGAKLINPDSTVQKWIAGGEVSLWRIIGNNFCMIRDKKYWQSSEETSVAWVAGTAMFARKKLFLELGGFDEQFFMYFEDTDLCRRMRLFGKNVLYFPAFSVLHHGGKSFSEKNKQKKAYYLSQERYFKKHRGNFEFLLLRFLRFFSF
ncbi:MAG: glycosyltransferase family 2 protein [Parcubacteria group bacterium]|jgi:hypothetical protein